MAQGRELKIKKQQSLKIYLKQMLNSFLHDQIKSELKDLLCGLCDDIFAVDLLEIKARRWRGLTHCVVIADLLARALILAQRVIRQGNGAMVWAKEQNEA